MERGECMTLLERKANSNQLKKTTEEIITRIDNDRIRDQERFEQAQSEQMQKIS
jgi:hypothetical protein